MRCTLLLALAAALAFAAAAPAVDEPARAAADVTASEFFNGKNLDGWEGLLDKFWRVEDGAIVGETKEDPKHNTFHTKQRSKY